MMKAITWLAAVGISMAAISAPAFARDLEGWSSDLEKSFAKAKAAKKCVLVEFTGSDWCPPCIVMRKNVFSKKEFLTAASQKFILVSLDFPQKDPALYKKNEPYAKKYRVDGFPTIILFSPEGKEFDRFYATDYPSTDEFLKHLDRTLERRNMD